MTKLNSTAPCDFHELSRMLASMAGVAELQFGAQSQLTHMLDRWNRFLTRTVGSTLAMLRQLAHEDPSAACRLGWFINKRMQQYLVLCAGVDHEDKINLSVLEFRATRQQLEDGAFVFPACNFLKECLGRGSETRRRRLPPWQEQAPDWAAVDRSRTMSSTRNKICCRRTLTTTGKFSLITHGLALEREVCQELFPERFARRLNNRSDRQCSSHLDRAVRGAH